MILYDELFTFIKVFENKNYTITAKLLGVSQPSIKRQIENLEKSFNKKLIRSNANNIEITEFGKKVYDCFKGKDKELESMINLLIKEDHKIEGDLLVTLPVNLSAKLITPYLPEFLQKHPNLRLKINFKQVEPNLYNTGFDIAVSLTAPTQESLIVKMLFKTKICLYATRKYIQKYGEPKTFDNINRNHTVSYLNLDDPKEASSINFKNKDTGEITTVQNDCIVTLNNVTNGLVLLQSGEFIIGLEEYDFLLNTVDDLVHILPEYEFTEQKYYLVLPSKYKNSKVQAFCNFLNECIQRYQVFQSSSTLFAEPK